MTEVKIIKRYANRKLYDTETSTYVVFKDIVGAIVAGREVLVVDNVTKEDITGNILLRALVETETDTTGQATTLRDIFKAGGLGKYVE